MSWQSWAQLLGLLMAALLILPAALRLPWKSRRILVYIAGWLAIFAIVGLIIQLLR